MTSRSIVFGGQALEGSFDWELIRQEGFLTLQPEISLFILERDIGDKRGE
jgi:hypothetical protein